MFASPCLLKNIRITMRYQRRRHLPINSCEINSEQKPDVTEKEAKDETVLGLDGVPILNGETTLAS